MQHGGSRVLGQGSKDMLHWLQGFTVSGWRRRMIWSSIAFSAYGGAASKVQDGVAPPPNEGESL